MLDSPAQSCPKCQGAAAKQWLAEREAELLPVPYYHVVFTLPAPIADIAYQNKAVISVLGGHVARCEDCAHALVAYNSCRNRHTRTSHF